MYGNARPILTLFGFEIRVDPSWLLIAGMVIWSLSAQYFPEVAPGHGIGVYLLLGTFGMLAFFASLVLHELAHSLVARGYGIRVGGITLFIFGGVAELTAEPRDPNSEFWIAIAGPAMSAVLGLVFTLFSGDGPLGVLCGYLGFANFALVVFNLLPAFPMDGGRVLRAALWHFTRDLTRATAIASQVGSAIAIAVIAAGVLSVLSAPGIGSFWLILIGFFIFQASRSALLHQQMHTALAGHRIAEIMTRTPIAVPPEMSLEDLVHRVMLARNVTFLPVVDAGRLMGFVDKSHLAAIPREDWPGTPVSAVMTPIGEAVIVPPDMNPEAALERMSRTGQRKFLVVEEGRLVGVLSVSDLIRYVTLAREIGGGFER